MRSTDEILADMAALLDGAAGRDLTDDEINQWESLDAELKASQLAEARARAAGDSGDGSDGGDGTAAPEPTPADSVSAAARRRASASIRDQHKRYNTIVVPAGRPSASPRQQEIEMDGFRAYLRTGKPNADMRPYNAQTTGTGSSGGFTVPEDFRVKIVEVIKSFGGVLNAAEQLPTSDGRPLRYPTIDDTSNTAVIAAENAAPASAGADLVFGDVELGAFEYNATGTGNTPLALPRSLVTDSAIQIEDLVARQLGLRIRRKMADDAVNGDASGKPEGILHGITGQEVGTALAYGDLVDLTMSLDAAYWDNAKFYMNQASLGAVSKLEDSEGILIFKQAITVTDGEPHAYAALAIGALLVPVVLDNAFPDILLTGGEGQNWGVFGDVQQGYVWRQVQDIEVLVDPYTANDKRQIKYNAWIRGDGAQQNTTAYKVIAGHTT